MKLPTKVRNAIRKAFNATAYVHRDFIAVRVGTEWTVIPSPTSLVWMRGDAVGETFTGRIVIHGAQKLLDGIERFEIYTGNNSPARQERGLPDMTTLTLITPAGAAHRTDCERQEVQPNWYTGCDYTVQLDASSTAEDYLVS